MLCVLIFKREKPHDSSYWTGILLKLALEVCLENTDGKAAHGATAALGRTRVETMVLRLPRLQK